MVRLMARDALDLVEEEVELLDYRYLNEETVVLDNDDDDKASVRTLQQQQQPESSSSSEPLLASQEYGYYDRLRAAWRRSLENPSVDNVFGHSTVETRAGSSILRLSESNGGGSIRLMHVVGMLVYSLVFSATVQRVRPVFSTSAITALLAQHHFNQRFSPVVPNLPQLTQNCNLYMTLDFYDTGANPRVGTTQFVRGPLADRNGTTAVVGPIRSATSKLLASLGTVHELPVISPRSNSAELDDPTLYRYFGRTIPSSRGDAALAMEFFTRVLGTTHLGIVYTNDESGQSLRQGLEEAAMEYRAQTGRQLVVQSVAVDFNLDRAGRNDTSVPAALDFLLATGFQHFFGAIVTRHVQRFLEQGAADKGLFGPDRFWLLADSVSPASVRDLQFPPDSVSAKALHGMGLLGRLRPVPNYPRFVQAFRQEGFTPDFGAYFATKSPLLSTVRFNPNLTFPPVQFLEYVYDAVMALGIAGCQVDDNNQFFTGRDLLDAFKQSNFSGASGQVLIDPVSGSRLYNSTQYVIYNMLQGTEINDDGLVAPVTVPAFQYFVPSNKNNNNNTNASTPQTAAWILFPDVVFNYSDFTTTPPPDLPAPEIRQLRLKSAFPIFLSLAVAIIVAAVGFAVWTGLYRDSHVVKASQPGFLLVICLGECLMALSVITAGAEDPPHSSVWADLSCMATQWLFGLGFSLTFSALFAKTWRINKLLGQKHHFRHVVVGPKDVILPGICIILGTVLILTVWTIVDPRRFEVEFDEDASLDRFGRPVEVIGECESEHGYGNFFLGGMFIIFGVAAVASNVQAYKTRGITTEYSESVFIALSSAIILQALMIALPVIFFDTDGQSSYIAQSLVLLLIPSTTLFVIFVPKVMFWVRYNKERKEKLKQRAERQKRSTLNAGSYVSGASSGVSGSFHSGGSYTSGTVRNSSTTTTGIIAASSSMVRRSENEVSQIGLDSITEETTDVAGVGVVSFNRPLGVGENGRLGSSRLSRITEGGSNSLSALFDYKTALDSQTGVQIRVKQVDDSPKRAFVSDSNLPLLPQQQQQQQQQRSLSTSMISLVQPHDMEDVSELVDESHAFPAVAPLSVNNLVESHQQEEEEEAMENAVDQDDDDDKAEEEFAVESNPSKPVTAAVEPDSDEILDITTNPVQPNPLDESDKTPATT